MALLSPPFPFSPEPDGPPELFDLETGDLTPLPVDLFSGEILQVGWSGDGTGIFVSTPGMIWYLALPA